MDKIAQIALSMIPNLGPSSCRKLLEAYPGEDIFALPPKELRMAFAGHLDMAEAIIGKTTHARAEEEWRFAERYGLRVLFCTDAEYPERLNREETQDCPVLLYVKGSLDLNPERALAVVGTRRATPQGRNFADQLIGLLKPLEMPVISGLAYGIDTAAHTAALNHGLPTVAVLGHGLDRIYPSQNRRLAAQIIEQGGALVTEYPSGTAINPGYFPARNRIIAALSDATVVVEASEKGGALITAAIAAGYHREVFAVPGRPSDTYSKGTNNLIATNKALILRDADDLCYQMGWPLPNRQSAGELQRELFRTLSPDAQRLYDLLKGQGQLTLDELVTLSGMSMPKVAGLMFDLEMQKVVRALPGRLYQPAD
ncbi:MAG: DNA-processing protein DprA [Bacteroidales bacterium]|nr:DNA-processing protein DprA [Bacteroidales bacterium]